MSRDRRRSILSKERVLVLARFPKAEVTVVVVPAVDGAAEEMLGLGEDADAA